MSCRCATNPASAIIRAMDGAAIPGGCDWCEAIQVVTADHGGRDVHRIAVHHDDWCPFLARMRKAAS